jgi:purine-nucleoside phosphorylase
MQQFCNPAMSEMQYFDQVERAAAAIRARVPEVPGIAIILGSGLGDFAASLGGAVTIPYEEVPHWPASRVIGHSGKLVVGTTKGRMIVALAGRSHLYEGHGVSRVAFAVRVLGRLGVHTLILTNAAGGVNTSFARGALMVIDDHINLTGHNPLVGENDERFGMRFPDMSEVYSARLRRVADEAGRALDLTLPHGIYAALLGPSYETPAEIRYLRTIGADAVGMSTVPEAIVARHMKMDVLGISCITNMAAGVLPQPLDHAEVMETAAKVREQFIALLEIIIGQL